MQGILGALVIYLQKVRDKFVSKMIYIIDMQNLYLIYRVNICSFLFWSLSFCLSLSIFFRSVF